jgi:hypothetical protein
MIRVVQRTPNLGVVIKMKKVKEAAQAVKVPEVQWVYDYPRMASGYYTSFVIGTDGRLWVSGLLLMYSGTGTQQTEYTNGFVPVAGQEGQKFKGVWVDYGGYSFILLRDDGALFFTGWAYSEEHGDTREIYPPVRLSGPNAPKFVWAASSQFAWDGFVSAVGEDGTLWTWCDFPWWDFPVMPNNLETGGRLLAEAGEEGGRWVSVSGGYIRAAAMKEDGSIWAWGFEQDDAATGQDIWMTQDFAFTKIPVKIGE